jgi:tRNA threonylcarbamoyladenosine biosynthesis protein TsaE
MNRLTFSSVSLDTLNEVAHDIISFLDGNKVVLFYGEMGSGKTTLIKEMCRQLGVKDGMSSPTFSIVNEYHAGEKKIYHFDLYRVKNLEECLDLGMEEYLYSGNYCFVEWPEAAKDILPAECIKVSLELNGIHRNVYVA